VDEDCRVWLCRFFESTVMMRQVSLNKAWAGGKIRNYGIAVQSEEDFWLLRIKALAIFVFPTWKALRHFASET